MDLVTILLFFVYVWGLGYGITRFLKNSDNFLERNLMRIGIGLGTIPFLGVLLSILRIPLDWRIFLVLSLVFPLIDLYKSDLVRNKRIPAIKVKLNKTNLSVLAVILLFSLSIFMYGTGAFKYPWLEDDDSWHHASSTKYISIEKNVFPPEDNFMYLNPYPPGYDLLMGILHQTSSSVYWTLKFFNALIISLGIIFFYFFVKIFTRNRNKALFATFVLASIPSYLSHFIWSHSLIVTLLFPAMYCIEMLNEDKKWMYPAIAVITSICLTQPTQPIKFAFLFGFYFIIKCIGSKKLDLRLLGSLFGGYFLSMMWWATRWREIFFAGSVGESVSSAAVKVSALSRLFSALQKVFPPNSGSATRAYSFNEIFLAKHQNMINNPIGIGLFISLLIVLGTIFAIISYRKLLSEEGNYLSITLLWGVFTFLGFNTMTFHLPFGFYSFRFWMLFAIPASILAAEGLWFLYSLGKQYGIPKVIIVFIVIIGIIFTSASQKYSVNTAIWPPGLGWQSYEEVQSYSWLKENLPINSKVFAFTDNFFVIGFDMFSCEWCKGIKEFKEGAFNETPEDLSKWLKNNKYEYVVIDGRTLRKYGEEEVNHKLGLMLNSSLFRPVHSSNALILMEVG